MKFDWSMVKGARTEGARRYPEPQPVAAPAQRFPNVSGHMPVAADVGAPLLDFITWCVPNDGSEIPGPIGKLHAALEDGDLSHRPASTPSPR
jgi:hypothetical protein